MAVLAAAVARAQVVGEATVGVGEEERVGSEAGAMEVMGVILAAGRGAVVLVTVVEVAERVVVETGVVATHRYSRRHQGDKSSVRCTHCTQGLG